MIIGVDSHPLGATDAGEGRERRDALRRSMCLARMPGDVRCLLSEGHEDRGFPSHHSLGVEPRELAANTFDKGKVSR